LQDLSSDHTVRRTLWPPPSADLTPPDFFLWKFLEETVYSHYASSPNNLKHNTEQAVGGNDQKALKSCKRHCEKGECLSSRRWRTFSASAVLTHCLSHFCISDKVKIKMKSLEQCFLISGTHTAVGLQRVIWWYVTLFGNYNVLRNSILKMLIILLKLFKCI
jgi:hypothetical protein